MTPTAKSSLSPRRKRLVELMQHINFGRIEDLVIRNGEPVLEDPAPRVIFEVKFSAENGRRAEAEIVDFALKAQVVDLFTQFDRFRDASVEMLSVKHGLPFSMNVETQH